MTEPVQIDSAVGSAVFSPDGRHRLRLDRCWCPTARDERKVPAVLWVMLNPSLAGAHDDDPTLTKCLGFSRRWGYERLIVVNLFSVVTPYAEELASGLSTFRTMAGTDPYIAEAAEEADRIVVAWGVHGAIDERRTSDVLMLLRRKRKPLWCLGKTAKGHPRHPGRIAYSTELEEF